MSAGRYFSDHIDKDSSKRDHYANDKYSKEKRSSKRSYTYLNSEHEFAAEKAFDEHYDKNGDDFWGRELRSKYHQEYHERYIERSSSSHEYHFTTEQKDRYENDDERRARKSKKHSKHKKHKRSREERDDRKEAKRRELLEIAEANLLKMIERGEVPKNIDVNKWKSKHLNELKRNKSITQWTELCRAISAKEAVDYDFSADDYIYSSDEERKQKDNEDEDEGNLNSVRHPFEMKKRRDIEIKVTDFKTLQCRNAKDIQKELRESFPVSCGSIHRKHELTWVEVKQPSEKPEKKAKSTAKVQQTQSTPASTLPSEPVASTSNVINEFETNTNFGADIGSILSQRLSGMRKLQEDPYNVVALKQIHQAQEMMQEWAKNKIAPGQYTGDTGLRGLSFEEISSNAAWARPDQFTSSKPITEGIGLHLMMKMGWRPGEGLGKNKSGSLEPVLPPIKLDMKGLTADSEKINKNVNSQLQQLEGLAKSPISLLQEYCSKKKWLLPLYELISDDGPDHRKNFLMKVTVNGIEYVPSISSATKKNAKALAAFVCLQAFGLLPKDDN